MVFGRKRARRLKARLDWWRIQRRLAGPRLIKAFGDAYPRPFFIEVGANDGEHHDHLRPHILSRRWRGIMVEPVPYIFERLRANYAQFDQVTLENAAIADRDGTMPFYYVVDAADDERERLPDWYDGIGSFDRETLLAHGKAIPDIEKRIVSADVPCMTFESLCHRHQVDQVDLLVIDTEGYDAEILRSIDFQAHQPRLVIYEHFHYDAAQRADCRALVERVGYETLEEGFDTFCLLPGGGDSLDQRWGSLKAAVPGVSVHDE